MPAPVRGDWVDGKLPARVRRLQLSNNYDDFRDHPLLIQQSLRGYAAMVTHIDSMVGVVLGHLREAGLVDNTLIIFTSDHGDQLFDHGNLAKGDFFRGSCNVPFIVRPPGPWAKERAFRPGRANPAAPVDLMDILPTVLEVCGLDVPETVEGRSLVPQLLDDGAAFRAYTFGNCGEVYGMSDGRTKYMWFGEDGCEFLFDVQADPNDCRDLSAAPEHAETMALWRGRMAGYLARHGDSHAEDGRLCPTPRELDEPAARARTGWNNRGRH